MTTTTETTATMTASTKSGRAHLLDRVLHGLPVDRDMALVAIDVSVERGEITTRQARILAGKLSAE